MSPEHEGLVRASWRRFEPFARDWAPVFYSRLFEVHPRSRALFAATDMHLMQNKFGDMLGWMVQSLGNPERLVSEVARLGRQNQTYGVRDADYASAGAALLWTLEQAFGHDWTPDLQAAWTEAFLLFSWVMRRAALKATGEFPIPSRTSSEIPTKT
jgi:hemoglobin-like flavoprotein